MSDDGGVADSLGRRRLVLGWVLAVAGTALLTAALVPFRNGPAPTFEAMLYLALAVGCALVGGRWPAVVASTLGALALNFFFTEPVHTLTVASPLNVLTLVVFVLVSLAVAGVVDSAARRRSQATAARAEAGTLAMLNRTVLGGEYDVPRLLELVRQTFGAEAAELVPPDRPVVPPDTAAVASRSSLLVLHGVSLGPADQRILTAFATHVGVLRDREELARQTAAARELEAGNRTRTALLAAVGHDLRTPLTGIRAAAGTLRRNADGLSAEDRAELLAAIEESTGRLSLMVADLLDMSRLQTGAVRPVLTVAPAGEAVRAVLAEQPDPDRVQVCEPLPDVRADTGLLERALANLIGNALRHTDGSVQVTGSTLGARVPLAVVDHGPGVPRDQRGHLFEAFQRLGDTSSEDGVGLGLAVARGLVEAQGGSLDAEETPGGGLTMTLDLAGPG